MTLPEMRLTKIDSHHFCIAWSSNALAAEILSCQEPIQEMKPRPVSCVLAELETFYRPRPPDVNFRPSVQHRAIVAGAVAGLACRARMDSLDD